MAEPGLGGEDLLPHPSGKFLVPPGQWLLGLVPLKLPVLWNGGEGPPCPGGRPWGGMKCKCGHLL